MSNAPTSLRLEGATLKLFLFEEIDESSRSAYQYIHGFFKLLFLLIIHYFHL